MKNMLKKPVTVLITVLMLCGLMATALAENASLPPETGTLTIHKYLMDDVSQAGEPNDGRPITIPSGIDPLEGIKFDVYKIEIPESGKVPVDGDYTVDSKTAATKLTSNSVVFNVSKVETLTTDTDGEVSSGALEQGFYLVIEQPDERVAAPAAPFVVAVPMTLNTEDGNTEWIKDVHVYPKNESLTAEKEPSVTSVELGETVTWTIEASVPTDIAAFKKYNIVDILDEALTYTADTVVVKGLDASEAEKGTLTERTHWTVEVKSDNKLTIEFTPAGRTELAKYKFVKITFDTTVNANILGNEDHSVTNKATVEFTNRFDEEKINETTETNIHTASVKIEKIDANTGTGVPGAQFQIASSEDNAKNGRYLKKLGGKIVDYLETGYDGADPWIEETDSGNPAIAIFEGLKDYIEDAVGNKTYLSYWLVETRAPAGYNLLAAPVKVTFTEENSKAELDPAYTVTTEIKNTTDFTLPRTGGAGTILFTVGGIVLIGLAAILIVTSRKKAKED